ncbi:flagellar basal body protein FliL [Paracoccus fistulariae]|uniref:Flagellar basal body protein FliL n=1 Tax=Paracoccus fistulariae TaxID=658446 RepID=A0ABY7SFU7_9RHOB|nr:flagellar basal body protein FliL [Paracoccus fistulariae]MDB6182661.1 flagellar basal body protein FliL [Paracoccus fistulariae]WCR05770.1 flagellar basal body protein FliL [Paracoccus fistulariae]
MTDVALDPAEQVPKKKRKLIPILVAVALAGAGFASTYMGFWTPSALLVSDGAKKEPSSKPAFVEVPPLDLSIAGSRLNLWLATSIETDEAYKKDVEAQMPRVLDAYTIFLTAIDPAAYDKRGVLEIIRAELLSRTRQALGEDMVNDLLITEFRLK